MVDADTRNCAALEAAICAGDSPRATSPLMAAIISSNSASPRSTPMRDADNSSSAIACALAAEYSHRHALEQWYRLSLHPLQHRGQDVSLGHAPSGGSPARPPLFGPRDTDLCCAPPRRPPSRASGPAPRPSACTTCPCPGRSRWRPCRPCPAFGRPWPRFFPSRILSPGAGPAARRGKGSQTQRDMSGWVRERKGSVRMRLQINPHRIVLLRAWFWLAVFHTRTCSRYTR